MDGVKVALPALHRAWREGGRDSLYVRVQTTAALAPAAAAALAALAAANEAEEDATVGADVRIGGGGVSVTPTGPVVFIDFCDEPDALTSWLQVFAAELQRQGITGKLTPTRPEASPIDHHQSTAITASFSVPLNWERYRAARGERPAPPADWYVDADVTRRLVTGVLPWCIGEGEVYFSHDLMQFVIEPTQAQDLVLAALQGRPSVRLTTMTGASTFRRVGFDLNGQVVVSGRWAGGDWAQEVAALEQILRLVAPIAESGFIRRSTVIPGAWRSVVNDLPPGLPYYKEGLPPQRILFGLRELFGRYVPDAYAVQLLSGEHLARATDLSSWDVSEVATGRYLVPAPDLGAWFAADEPETATLAQARRDFGDLILNPTTAHAFTQNR